MLTRRLFAVAGLGVAAVLVAACGKQEAPAPKAEAKKEEPKKPESVIWHHENVVKSAQHHRLAPGALPHDVLDGKKPVPHNRL